MQYALLKLTRRDGGEVWKLLDACELEHLEHFAAGKLAVKHPEQDAADTPAVLLYGAFLPDRGASHATCLDYMNEMKGKLVQVSLPHRIAFIGCDDIFIGEPQTRGRHLLTPVAALVRSVGENVELQRSKSQFALTTYLAYTNAGQALTVRPGVLALKATERRFKGVALTPANWREFVDEQRMIETAWAVN